MEALAIQGLTPQRHHKLLLNRLEAISRGDIDRLMVLMPPGSAKSTYASILFPAWYMAAHPGHAVIAASHTADLAERFGRRVRNTIAEHEYTLDLHLSPDNASAGQWSTTAGGEYFAAGVLGSITGRRADLAIIDDPVKSRQEADSETVSERVWEWWKADFSTRLKPGARVVLIMTRWSEHDLGGRLLDDMRAGGWPWEVLRLPMEAESDDLLGRAVGEPLWPEWFTGAMRAEAKRDPRTWSALYQQSPAPDTGSYFLRDWLHPVSSMPPRESLRIYGASDYAVTADGGDYTVHVVVGMDSMGRLWLLDMWRGQTSSDVWIDAFCALVRTWKPIGWAEESGQIRAGIGPFLVRSMREKQAYVARHDFPTRGDKAIRAQSIRGRMAIDGLRYSESAPWRADFESELMTFPVGKHDDQCLAEGTLISMADGTVLPIESVRAGAMVATPYGACEVLCAAVTNEAAAVYRVTLSDGTTIDATANHPVMVCGKGFTRVDALGISDQIEMGPVQCGEVVPKQTLLNTAGIDTGDTQRAASDQIGTTITPPILGAGSSTGIFGRMNTGLSRLSTTSIIRMGTHSITTYLTSNASPSKPIADTTLSRLSSSLSTWLDSVLLPLSGTAAMLGVHGTPSMVASHGVGVREGHSQNNASLVVRHSRQHLSVQGSAPVAVSGGGREAAAQRGGVMSLMARRLRAGVARVTSLLSGRTCPSTAQRRAACVTAIEALSAPARVLNLTVNRAHAFYANGVLTHNCDALGLAGQLLDLMIQPEAMKVAEPPRDMSRMTLGEAWKLADPRKRVGQRVRI